MRERILSTMKGRRFVNNEILKENKKDSIMKMVLSFLYYRKSAFDSKDAKVLLRM